MKTNTAARSNPSFGHLEQRVANQERRINQGVRAGTLSNEEATSLRSRLSDVQQRLQTDGFEPGAGGRRGEQARALNGIGRDIRSQKHDGNFDPATRMNNIDRRIERGLADGSLTQDEAAALKTQAGELRSQLQGATTPEARQEVMSKISDLSRSVRSERHDGEMDTGRRAQSFEQRIAQGVQNGTLNEQEAARLRERLSTLQNGGTADANTVNSLSRDIFTQKHDRQTNTPVQQSAVGSRIDALEQAGTITPEQATEFRNQLQQIQSSGHAAGPQLNELTERLNALVQ